MATDYPEFNVYKGLQKPLIFKGFKGKFIYIGGECIVSSLLICVALSSIFSILWGCAALVLIMFGGLGLTSHFQKKGLHNKDKRKGIFIFSKTFVCISNN